MNSEDKHMWERARDYSDSALSAIGLERRRGTADLLLPAIGLFGLGIVVGAGLGLMFAPKRGIELRGDVRRGLNQVGQKIRRRANGVAEHDLEGGNSEDRESITAVPTSRG
ncbi:MAG TPA: YtxH domain-containing protein [Nannocystaceae bacterium]|nr:YtxH domain-containing protein [Nannocystaceae bacterium]